MERDSSARPRLGVSACALGEAVRFDGGHKRMPFVARELAEFVEIVPVCPEAEAGLSTPRPTMRLVQEDPDEPVRLLESRDPVDHTDRLRSWSEAQIERLRAHDLDGFVLQTGSPSCGMERVKVYRPDGSLLHKAGTGLFVETLRRAFPQLALEETGRLNDPHLRDRFVARVFASRRVKELFAPGWRPRDLVAFHSREKMALLARSRVLYSELGGLVARQAESDRAFLEQRYTRVFLEAMSITPSKGRLFDTLQHLLGHFKEVLGAQEKAEAHGALAQFRAGLLPLSTVVHLVRLLAARHGRTWVSDQSILRPAPLAVCTQNLVYGS